MDKRVEFGLAQLRVLGQRLRALRRGRNLFLRKLANESAVSVSTVVDNIVFTREGSKLGLITTRDSRTPLHVFGGCCGMLAGVFGSDLHVKQIVVRYTASVNCAFFPVAARALARICVQNPDHRDAARPQFPRQRVDVADLLRRRDSSVWRCAAAALE